MSKRLKIAIITDEMSPLVKAIVNSEFELVAIAALDESCGDSSGGASGGLVSKLKDLKRRLSGETDIASLCEQRKIAHCLFTKQSIAELTQFVRDVQPDITILYCVPILPQELLEIAKIGTLNLHPSMLPAYRGADPASHMALDNQNEGGITLHFVDAGEDTGPILLQQAVEIKRGVVREDYVYEAVYKIGVPMLIRGLQGLAENSLSASPQPQSTPTRRARRLSNDDIWSAIDWREWPIERVWFTLRYFQGRKNLLPRTQGWRRHFEPVIDDYTLQNNSDYAQRGGELVQADGENYFIHPQGRINICYPFSIKAWIKNLLAARNRQ